jgi:peptidoglycan/xylan/chitin deacetylase (PgdA/CDA1 family)
MGLCRDFWLQFEDYAKIEEGLGSTYFFIPFKGRTGERVSLPKSGRRAARYDVRDAGYWVRFLFERGHEIAVHGIDAWHDSQMGHLEREAVAHVVGAGVAGIRVHWLCFDADSPRMLEDAGYSYDSTFGYNDTVGFRAGTAQVFRPLGAKRILEIPLHIQDVALFSPSYMNLNGEQAAQKCREIMNHVWSHGGVLSILWHHRSLGPETPWADFYVQLLKRLKDRRVWFGTASQIVDWFRLRRAISFRQGSPSDGGSTLLLESPMDRSNPPFVVRIYMPLPDQADSAQTHVAYTDVSWSGQDSMSIPLPRERFTCA